MIQISSKTQFLYDLYLWFGIFKCIIIAIEGKQDLIAVQIKRVIYKTVEHKKLIHMKLFV